MNQIQRSSQNVFSKVDSNLATDLSAVKFYGRYDLVPIQSKEYVETVQILQSFSESKVNNEETWKGFNRVIGDFVEHLENPNYQLRQYQIDLIREVIIGYLNSLNGRFFTDSSRVNQVTEIMTIILLARNDPHPALCLTKLEGILKSVNSRSYFFQSRLAELMNNAISRQWRPIINDNRALLSNVGSKLVFLGLLGVVGWPLVLLYPMINHSQKLMKIMNDFDHSKRLSAQAIFDLIQILVLVFVCFQLTTIMATYATIGYTAGIVGVAALGMAQNEALVKEFSPVIAQNAPIIDKMVSVIDSGDFRRIGNVFSQNTTNLPQQFPQSDRVEELSNDSVIHSSSRSGISNETENEDPIPEETYLPPGLGLRQRK